MRKAIYRGTPDEGRAILARADAVQVAMVGDDGRPILRTFNAVVAGDVLAFHGAPAGEKMEGVGRPVVVAAHETVASIPSWFIDPLRACPATTYYLAAQAHGVLRRVDDPARKALLLEALMQKYQPEGRYTPIGARDPLYRKQVQGLLVVEVNLDDVACKTKLGQNRPPHERERILEHLWRRGGPGDVRAIALIVARAPELAPSFLAVPPALRDAIGSLQCAFEDDELDEVVELLRGVYWLEGAPRSAIRESLVRASAAVGARDPNGRLVGFARAVSDGRCAWLYDVIVAPDLRARGVGRTVVSLLLDHPAVRGARHVRLATRDAMPFYRRFGFRDLDEAPRHPWRSFEMIRANASEAAAEPQSVRSAADERQDRGLVEPT